MDIAAAKKRCEAATKAPWKAELDYLSAFIPGKRPNGEIIGRLQPSISDLFPREQKYANAEFAAHARTDLPAALEAQGKLEAVQALRDKLWLAGPAPDSCCEATIKALDRILRGTKEGKE